MKRLAFALVLATLSLGGGSPALGASSGLVISQVYGGGGNAGAPYTHDYIEIFNRGTATVILNDLSLQYASATGTGNFGSTSTQITEISGILAPGAFQRTYDEGLN